MTTYHPGQRVILTHLGTPDTDLQAGDQGTVHEFDPDQQTVAVDWDNSTHRLIRLGQGDRIEPLPAGPPATGGTEPSWDQLIAAVRAFGAQTGRAAADTWRQQTFGEASTGEAKATARDTLTGIDDDDPDVLDGLPSFATADGTVTPPAYAGLSALLAGDAIGWRPESSRQWAPAAEAFQDAYDTAALARVTEICRIIASPTGDGRDLSHLHPDQVRLGSAGVFSGEWMLDDDGFRECYQIGFAGTLVGDWNGWAVFSCTRQVADAIVADLEQVREAERDSLRTAGVTEKDLERQVNATLTALGFDGDTLVADQRVMQGDPQAIERVDPDVDGRYVVMGRNWQWQAVDPNRCTRIVGDLPDPDQRQQFVPLAHTPAMRLPDDRLTLTLLKHWPVHGGLAYIAALTHDGQRIATVGNDGAGGGTDLLLAGPAFSDQQWRQYLDRCRYDGQPVTQQRLLDALADEAYLGAAVAQADRNGGTQLRLVDPDGHTLALRPIIPAPRDLQALLELGPELAREAATGQWQIWDGRTWFTVPGSTRRPG